VALGFPGEFETVGSIAEKIGESITYRLPEDYFAILETRAGSLPRHEGRSQPVGRGAATRR
jgi:hypothetical protein